MVIRQHLDFPRDKPILMWARLPATRRAHTDVETSESFIEGPLTREEVVLDVQPRWWKYPNLAQEQSVHLIAGAAHGRGLGDDLRPHWLPVELPAREVIDRGLV